MPYDLVDDRLRDMALSMALRFSCGRESTVRKGGTLPGLDRPDSIELVDVVRALVTTVDVRRAPCIEPSDASEMAASRN